MGMAGVTLDCVGGRIYEDGWRRQRARSRGSTKVGRYVRKYEYLPRTKSRLVGSPGGGMRPRKIDEAPAPTVSCMQFTAQEQIRHNRFPAIGAWR
jgi:hypothetical protein